jgi:hypothetical protein
MKIKWVFFFIWILSIFAFVIGQFLAPPNYATLPNNPWGALFGTSVVFGICSFLLMLLFIFLGNGKNSNKNKKTDKSKSSNKLLYFIAGGIVLLLATVIFLSQRATILELSKKAQDSELAKATMTPSPTAIAKVDSDPIIDCESSYPNCKGTSIRVRRSQCSKITCCGFDDGRWTIYPSVEKCTEAQKSAQPQQTAVPQTAPAVNKVPVFLTYSKYTIYCPSQNVDAVKSIDATMTSRSQEWAKNYNDCVSTFQQTDSCYVSCRTTFNTDWNACVATYGYTNDTACEKGVSDNELTCFKTCPSTATACSWVYSEQKSMSSQISNLCK